MLTPVLSSTASNTHRVRAITHGEQIVALAIPEPANTLIIVLSSYRMVSYGVFDDEGNGPVLKYF